MGYGANQFISISLLKCTGSTPARVDKFFLIGSPKTDYEGADFYTDEGEAGKTTHLSEAAPVITRRTWNKALELYGNNHTLTAFAYWAGNDGTPGVDTADIGGAGSNVIRHVFSGPVPAWSTPVPSFALEDVQDTASNTNMNRLVDRCVVESFEIVIGRGAGVRCSVNIRGGNPTDIGGAPTATTSLRSAMAFIPGQYKFFMNASTLGVNAANKNGTVGVTATPTTAESILVAASIVDATDGIAEVRIRFLNPMSVDDSYLALSDVVVGVDDWARAPAGQQVEVDLLVDWCANSGAGPGVSAGFNGIIAAIVAGGRRSFEAWLHAPTNIASSGTAYADWRIVIPAMIPVGQPVEVTTSGMGRGMMLLKYRAQYHTTAAFGWYVESTIKGLAGGYGD